MIPTISIKSDKLYHLFGNKFRLLSISLPRLSDHVQHIILVLVINHACFCKT